MTSKLNEDWNNEWAPVVKISLSDSSSWWLCLSIEERYEALMRAWESIPRGEIEFNSSNYGAPPEGSGIYTNLEFASVDMPQAWKDSHGNWFYNFSGALELASFLGKRLPTSWELVDYIDNNIESFSKYPGYRDAYGEDFNAYGWILDFWSSIQVWELSVCDVYLIKDHWKSKQEFSNPRHGLSVRLVSDKKPRVS